MLAGFMLRQQIARMRAPRRCIAHVRSLSSASRGRAGLFTVVVGGSVISWVASEKVREETTYYVKSTRRSAAAIWCVLSITLDYKQFFRSCPEDAPDYTSSLATLHTKSAEKLLVVAQGAVGQGIFVKSCQHVCSLKPAIPGEYTDVLSKLHDNVAPRPLDEVLATLHDVLGAPDEVFESFDSVPLGAASIAQVHRATTRDGREVAVKVQHRHMDRMVAADLWLLGSLDAFVKWSFDDFQFGWLLAEIEAAVTTEMDFRNEGRFSEMCAYNFRGNAQIYVPKVHWDMSSKKVLVMEYIQGAKISDVDGIRGMGVAPAEVSALVTSLFSEQIFCHGLVHCDPHPGNLFVRPLPRSRLPLFHAARWGFGSTPAQVVLLDHGLYRRFDDRFRLNFCRLFRAMVDGDKDSIQAACAKLGIVANWELLPIIFIHRPMGGRTGASQLGHKMNTEEKLAIRGTFDALFGDGNSPTLMFLTKFLESLPRDMLFVLRTFNLVRVLNRDLGGTSGQRFVTQLQYAFLGDEYAPAPQLQDDQPEMSQEHRSHSEGWITGPSGWRGRVRVLLALAKVKVFLWFIRQVVFFRGLLLPWSQQPAVYADKEEHWMKSTGALPGVKATVQPATA